MTDLNSLQPIRPTHHPVTNEQMLYATMPKMNGKRIPSICDEISMITQARLYRAACQGIVGLRVSIAELYDYCFFGVEDLVSKQQMGPIVIRTTIYEPRILVNNKSTDNKPTSTYTFRTDLDFRFGLEWMICAWLRKFLLTQGEQITTPEQMNQELLLLGKSNDDEYLSNYESQFGSFMMEEPNWVELCKNLREQKPDPKPGIVRIRPRSLMLP